MARKRFEFWLNDQRPDDWVVYELIGKLKKPAKGQGQFTRAIREGLRLWTSLREHRIDVLLELFPWVSDAIKQMQPIKDDGGAGQLDEIKSMLEIALAEKVNGNGYVMKHLTPSVPSIPLPEAPKAVVSQAVAASADSIADNFLSMFQ